MSRSLVLSCQVLSNHKYAHSHSLSYKLVNICQAQLDIQTTVCAVLSECGYLLIQAFLIALQLYFGGLLCSSVFGTEFGKRVCQTSFAEILYTDMQGW